MANKTPLYNLKAVIQEVGINPVTLRAWERRYDLLKPKRSPGGHRLYSRHDIEMLKWLIERQGEGLSISSAIEMWKSQHLDEKASIEQFYTPVPVIGTGESILDTLRERWLSACLSFDDLRANRILDEAFVVASPEMIIGEVLQKGLARIGDLWYTGTVSVQQEHFTSAIAMRRIHTLLTAVTPPTRSGHILAACPPGEEHDFILLEATYLLRRRGWDVVYLGANVPIIELDKTIRSSSPVLILSAAQTLIAAASLCNLSEYLTTLGLPLVYGGGIFNQIPTLTQRISGHFLGTEVASVPMLVEKIIASTSHIPIAPLRSPRYSQTLSSFLENKAAIIAQVVSAFHPESIDPSQLENACISFSQFIVSALALGDIQLLDHAEADLIRLINSYGLAAPMMSQLQAAYSQAVENHLGEGNQIILDWLTKYA